MSEVLMPTSPLPQAGITVGALTCALLPDRDIVSIGPFSGQRGAVDAAISEAFGVMLSDKFQEEESPKGFVFFKGAHNQWFCSGPKGRNLTARLTEICAGRAAITNQTDSRTRLSLRGPGAAAIAAKLVPVNLHPSVFGAGQTAMTLAGHIPVTVTCREAFLNYEFMVFRSLAGSLFHDIHVAMNGGIPNSERV